MANTYTFRSKTRLEIDLESLFYINRKIFIPPLLDEQEKRILGNLRENGFAIIEDFINSQTINEMQSIFQRDLEIGNFEIPALAQSKIDPKKHKDLIENYLLGDGAFLKRQGLAFDRDEFQNLEQCIEDFRPSTLKSYFNPKTPLFFNVMLSDTIRNIVESYLGIRPFLIEAYTRRNFPANYPVMNHHWHRDTNNKTFLLKAFLFLTNCSVENGPHHYMRGTHRDFKLNGNKYYTDDQVDASYSLEKNLILSEVKAGTLIIEDTRGLHRAGIPQKGYRDLVYGVFIPIKFFSRWRISYYSIVRDIYDGLDSEKRAYIPKRCIIQGLAK